MKIRLWLQKPPRVEWVLRVIHTVGDRTIIARTWFPEYGPQTPPPPCVTGPAALTLADIVRRVERDLEPMPVRVEIR